MKEKTLLRIAIACCLIGILVLFIVANNVEIQERNIGKITLKDVDESVRIKGVVERVVEKEKVVIVDIVQNNEMSVVLFKERGIDIKRGDKVEVVGQLKEYNGKMELIGDELIVS
jgi:DNA/RNA endonuclease YhcR with UshA esterase domain